MDMLSSEYGWTPDQIRQSRSRDIENYMDIISIKRTIKKSVEFKNRK